jgi:hypothetical protein
LGDDIVVSFDLVRKDRCPKEFLKGIDHAMKELEN